jgi:hypothetical protein
VTGLLTPILAGLIRLAIWGFRQWMSLCIKLPLMVWAWLWTRPWSLKARLGVIVLPWATVAVLVVIPEELVSRVAQQRSPAPVLQATARLVSPMVQAERIAVLKAALALIEFAHPPDAHPNPYPTDGRPFFEAMARAATVLLIELALIPFVISVVMGGPVWVPCSCGEDSGGRSQWWAVAPCGPHVSGDLRSGVRRQMPRTRGSLGRVPRVAVHCRSAPRRASPTRGLSARPVPARRRASCCR